MLIGVHRTRQYHQFTILNEVTRSNLAKTRKNESLCARPQHDFSHLQLHGIDLKFIVSFPSQFFILARYPLDILRNFLISLKNLDPRASPQNYEIQYQHNGCMWRGQNFKLPLQSSDSFCLIFYTRYRKSSPFMIARLFFRFIKYPNPKRTIAQRINGWSNTIIQRCLVSRHVIKSDPEP